MATTPLASAPPHARWQIILLGDCVLVYDTDRYRWHVVASVLLGERTTIQIVGADFYFDASLIAKHERRERR
jgi:hypothetical protein